MAGDVELLDETNGFETKLARAWIRVQSIKDSTLQDRFHAWKWIIGQSN